MIPETEATYRLGPPGLARGFHLRYLRIIETPIALALLMGVSFFGGIQSAK